MSTVIYGSSTTSTSSYFGTFTSDGSEKVMSHKSKVAKVKETISKRMEKMVAGDECILFNPEDLVL